MSYKESPQDKAIREILESDADLEFLEDVMTIYERETGNQLRGFWPVYFVGISIGRRLKRKPIEEVNDPISLRELAGILVDVLRGKQQAKDLVRAVDDANKNGKKFDQELPIDDPDWFKQQQRIEAQELLNRSGSLTKALAIIDQLP